jgi:hypothetical protein
MELFAEAISALGALLLSVSCGLLMEELVFGGLAWLCGARRQGPSNDGERKNKEFRNKKYHGTSQGEPPCLH